MVAGQINWDYSCSEIPYGYENEWLAAMNVYIANSPHYGKQKVQGTEHTKHVLLITFQKAGTRKYIVYKCTCGKRIMEMNDMIKTTEAVREDRTAGTLVGFLNDTGNDLKLDNGLIGFIILVFFKLYLVPFCAFHIF